MTLASFSQEERLHLGRHIHLNNHNVVLAFEITGPLKPDLVEQAVEAVTMRHQALRQHFPEGNRLAVAPRGAGVEFVEVDDVVPARRLERAIQIVAKHWDRPYNLTTGPLLRSTVVSVDLDHHVLALMFDHIVVDGWSLSVLGRELWQLYESLDAALPPAPQFPDFAWWEREYLQGERLERPLRYWQRQLDGIGPIPASGLVDPSCHAPRQVGIANQRLDHELAARVRRFADAEGISAVPVYQAALAATIRQHQHGGDPADVGMLTMVGNRSDPANDGLVGYLTTRAVIRVSCAGDPPFPELAQRAASSLWGAVRHQRMPHSLVVKHLAPDLYGVLATRVEDIPPHVYFNVYEDRTSTLPQPRGLSVRQLAIPTPRVPRGGLDVGVRSEAGTVTLQLKYLTDRYSPRWAAVFLADMRRKLAELP
ncbi:condensation domain-containing protein [Kutzneria sp. CA-103260]|uniref:condensation domain-containing protein n=1 Tax=Kutzneria sp. CA-103260 TaxID=2802641 RepID=UPI001BADDBA6|nr:condensation domain-containing protein [Kutzneria sp. CA-103260]QUQ63943.1 non-ribosomal peptide synthetase [Kutzneria sp. CA-103260]